MVCSWVFWGCLPAEQGAGQSSLACGKCTHAGTWSLDRDEVQRCVSVEAVFSVGGTGQSFCPGKISGWWPSLAVTDCDVVVQVSWTFLWPPFYPALIFKEKWSRKMTGSVCKYAEFIWPVGRRNVRRSGGDAGGDRQALHVLSFSARDAISGFIWPILLMKKLFQRSWAAGPAQPCAEPCTPTPCPWVLCWGWPAAPECTLRYRVSAWVEFWSCSGAGGEKASVDVTVIHTD